MARFYKRIWWSTVLNRVSMKKLYFTLDIEDGKELAG
jgi:hypothetical protein